MEFDKAFSFITEDEDWLKKVGIGALLLLVVIGGFAVLGWGIEIARRVANKEEKQLPDWDNIGEFFVTGLKACLVGVIWSIPIGIIAACVFTPLALLSETGEDWVTGVAIFANACFGLIAFVYGLVVGLISIPMGVQVGEGKSIGEVVNPASSFRLFRANIGGYIIAALVGGIIASLLSSLGVIVCVVGTYFGGAFGTAVYAHLIGQAHGKATENLANMPAVPAKS